MLGCERPLPGPLPATAAWRRTSSSAWRGLAGLARCRRSLPGPWRAHPRGDLARTDVVERAGGRAARLSPERALPRRSSPGEVGEGHLADEFRPVRLEWAGGAGRPRSGHRALLQGRAHCGSCPASALPPAPPRMPPCRPFQRVDGARELQHGGVRCIRARLGLAVERAHRVPLAGAGPRGARLGKCIPVQLLRGFFWRSGTTLLDVPACDQRDDRGRGDHGRADVSNERLIGRPGCGYELVDGAANPLRDREAAPWPSARTGHFDYGHAQVDSPRRIRFQSALYGKLCSFRLALGTKRGPQPASSPQPLPPR